MDIGLAVRTIVRGSFAWLPVATDQSPRAKAFFRTHFRADGLHRPIHQFFVEELLHHPFQNLVKILLGTELLKLLHHSHHDVFRELHGKYGKA